MSEIEYIQNAHKAHHEIADQFAELFKETEEALLKIAVEEAKWQKYQRGVSTLPAAREAGEYIDRWTEQIRDAVKDRLYTKAHEGEL